MNTGEILIYHYSQGSIKIDVRLLKNYFKGFALKIIDLTHLFLHTIYQPFTALLTIIHTRNFAISKNCYIFDNNNTCHASHSNSAPGQVFAFYRLLVFKSLNTKTNALQ